MTTVGTKELKNKLSHYLRLVRAGARILVTDHGRPVAELGPVTKASRRTEDAWVEAAARGEVVLPKRRDAPPVRPLRLRKRASLSDAVLEDRR
jgi:prevent-host-death family protein